MKLRSLSIVAISLALGACATGGGYGPGSTRPIRADDKPYLGEFQKNSALIKFDDRVRDQAIWADQPLAWAIGDFFGDGTQGKFAAIQRYNPVYLRETIFADPAKFNGIFSLWHTDPKTGEQTKTWSMVGCLHPRHAAAADFNQDGKLDVVVGCHGYINDGGGTEVAKAPGEYSVMLINDGKGGFTASKFGMSDSFYHGISAGDVNGDGYPDIVVAAPEGKDQNMQPPIFFWINQKDGTFKKDFNRIKGLGNGCYGLARLVDVDGDDILDLAVGGEEVSSGAETAVLFGTKDGKFGPEKISIPRVRDQGGSHDILPITNNGERVLYVLRTGDAAGGGAVYGKGYYEGMTVQAVNLTTGKETIYRSNRSWLSDILPFTKNGQNGVSPYDWMKGDWFISNTIVDAPK